MPDIQMNLENRRRGSLSLPAGGVKITEAFKTLLGRKEFAAITIADIAATSGVNAALIYKYFGDKRGLLHHVLGDIIDEYLENLDRDLKGIKGALNKLRKLVWSHLNMYETNRVLSRILLLEVRNHHGYFESNSYQKVRWYSSMVKEIIEEGIRDGDIRGDIPVWSIRQVLFGAIEHQCLPGVIQGKAFCAEDLTDDLCNIIFSGIEKRR
jgi:TetR/AcrR family fatty acid metabolism transcriptional regulator